MERKEGKRKEDWAINEAPLMLFHRFAWHACMRGERAREREREEENPIINKRCASHLVLVL